MGGTINRVSLLCPILLTVLWGALPQSPAETAVRVTARGTSVQPGSVVVLTIAGADQATVVRARAFGRDLSPFRIDGNTWMVLVGIDLDVRPGSHSVEIDGGLPGSSIGYVLKVAARRFGTRALKVDPALVNPPPEAAARIAQEADRLRRLWEAPPGNRIWSGPFIRPVPDAANSSFGTRSFYNGVARSAHGGTDFLSPSGRPIAAPNAGRVVLAESLYFSGGTVVLDHGGGVLSVFAHLSRIAVHEADDVKPGDIIGNVGATGRVTGPHLHWAVRIGGARVDPLLLLAALRRE